MKVSTASVALSMALAAVGLAQEPVGNGIVVETGRLTRSTAEAFGQKLADVLGTNDTDKLEELIDDKACFERAVQHRGFGKAYQNGLWSGFSEIDSSAIAQALLKLSEAGEASCRLIGVRDRPAGPCPLFRFIGDGGVAYQELLLEPRESGPVIVDVYAFNAGDYFSGLTGELWSVLAAELDPAYAKRLPGGSVRDNRTERFSRMVSAHREENHPGVLEAYRNLPPVLQDNTSALLVLAQSAMEIDDNSYTAALGEIAKRRPHDAMLQLMLLDLYYTDGKYDQMLKIVDRADKLLGGDPYLDCLRVTAHIGKGDLETASRLAQKADRANLGLSDTIETIFEVRLAMQDYRGAARALDRLVDEFDWDFSGTTSDDFDPQFVASAAGQRWLTNYGIE